MAELITSVEDLNKVEKSVMVNGVDNPNILSVDSTDPISTTIDEVVSAEDLSNKEKEKEKEVGTEKEKVVVDKKASSEKDAEDVEKKKDGEKKVGEESEEGAELTPTQIRINKAVKKQRAAERERDYEKAKRLAVEEELAKVRTQVPSTDKPVREDFVDDEEYLEALTDWKVKEALKTKTDEGSKAIAEEAEKKDLTQYTEELDNAVEKGRKLYKDFDKVVIDNKDVIITADMVSAMLDSDIASELMYHVASNPDVAEELANLSVVKMARKLVIIEKEIVEAKTKNGKTKEETKNEIANSKEASKEKKVSSAPEPITPVHASGNVQKRPEDMTAEEYRRWRASKS